MPNRLQGGEKKEVPKEWMMTGRGDLHKLDELTRERKREEYKDPDKVNSRIGVDKERKQIRNKF